MSRAMHSDIRYPHERACAECRALELCNCCGRPAPRDSRCTNGHCSRCHQAVCTAGGIGGPNHGSGLAEVREAAARGLEHTQSSMTMTHEAIALDTCKQLVQKGRSFSVSRIAEGWRFIVDKEGA
jgi:hypothetical protein